MSNDREQFIKLASPRSTNHCAEWSAGVAFSGWGKPPVDPETWSAGARTRDLRVLLPGKKCAEIVWTYYSECLIQDSLLNLFRSKGFKGFITKPVEARFKNARDATPPILHELVVTGWGGMAAKESGIELVSHDIEMRYSKYSGVANPAKLIDRGQWDGSDFFMVWPLPKFIFVTRRVIDALREAKCKGYQAIELHDMKFNPKDTLSPGVLSSYMPLSIAKTRAASTDLPTV